MNKIDNIDDILKNNANKLLGQHVKVIKKKATTNEVKYFKFTDYFGVTPYKASLEEIKGDDKIELPMPLVVDAIMNSRSIEL